VRGCSRGLPLGHCLWLLVFFCHCVQVWIREAAGSRARGGAWLLYRVERTV
jgi:hypothetical protein